MKNVMCSESSFLLDVGTPVGEAPNSAQALQLAGLDWNVQTKPLFVEGREVPNYYANVRDSDEAVLGIVSEKYRIVQNTQAFAFTDHLLESNQEVKYLSAGSFQGGKRIFLSAQMPNQTILGDEYVPYLFFLNSHDGNGAVRVCVTPVRVVCTNMISLTLKGADRSWSMKHVGNLETKERDARAALLQATDYMSSLSVEAERLSQIKLSAKDIQRANTILFPIPSGGERSPSFVMRAVEQRDTFVDIFSNKLDLGNLRNTAWGYLQAVADFETHTSPIKTSPSFHQRRLMNFVDGRIQRFQVAQEVLQAVA